MRAANALEDLKDDIAGQGLVEYALIIALVAILLVGALVAVRLGINNTFNRISNCINATNSTNNC
ncbi:MAG: Flp family type IVb pilin [Chloroflexi bacterium]|nr:Flp family type IVb pilin [Chloroflexota bacterium]